MEKRKLKPNKNNVSLDYLFGYREIDPERYRSTRSQEYYRKKYGGE